MKPLLMLSLLGLTAGASSLTTFQLVHHIAGGEGRYEMQVLPDGQSTVVTLDRQTGDVRYIYRSPGSAPPSQFAIDLKHDAVIGQAVPPSREKNAR